ncbi:hypothetical protein RND81_10G032300 [Saponaria officinalis]|uniref:Uncharacterized protein n=1 Tax=Saponaria officinalis TaxID=3572 RepID=A0AAW1HZW4_SAPOF
MIHFACSLITNLMMEYDKAYYPHNNKTTTSLLIQWKAFDLRELALFTILYVDIVGHASFFVVLRINLSLSCIWVEMGIDNFEQNSVTHHSWIGISRKVHFTVDIFGDFDSASDGSPD